MYNIIQAEWRNLFRSRILVLLMTLLLLLSVFTVWQAASQFNDAQAHRKAAAAHMRERFTAQGAVNPHSAAHYGHFVYKKMNVLSLLDEGVNPFTGITLRLEAHQQNEVAFAAAQSSSSLLRFGQLRLHLVLQVLLPLFIIFCCYDSISRERENGTLKLLLTQCISLRQLVWGKTLAYALVWWLLLTVNILVLWLATISNSDPVSGGKMVSIWLLYGVYYFIITGLSVYVSARAKKSGNALLILLAAWIICTVLLPKATANLGENAAPLLSRIEMTRRINEDNKKGLNGHDPQNERTQRFKDSVMKKYGVDSLQKAPVNVDGLTMQADEEYHNTIYDKHFGDVQQTIARQNKVTAISSYINPFAAVRGLSMSLAGTDIQHHMAFTEQAEAYRRMLIKKLNDEMAYGGSKTDDWEWAVPATYWQKIPDFHFEAHHTSALVQQRRHEALALLCWLVLTLLLLQFATNRISILK